MIKKAMIGRLAFIIAMLTCFKAQAVNSVTIAWDPSPDVVSGYIIYAAIGGTSQVGATDVGNTTQAVVGSLVDGQTYIFYATAYDSDGVESDPSNSVTYTNTISNQQPVIAAIPDQTADEGKLLQFTVSASDPDAGQTLTFALTSAPNGAQIDPQTGVFSWVPQSIQATSTNAVTVTVTDNGSPALTASQTFNVVVRSGYYLVVNNSPYGAVTTSPLGSLSADGSKYISGTSVSVTAAPKNGYRFDHWLLDGSAFSQNPLSITMTKDHTLTPYFARGSKVL